MTRRYFSSFDHRWAFALYQIKTESSREINCHKKEIKVRGRTENEISQETEEGGGQRVQAVDTSNRGSRSSWNTTPTGCLHSTCRKHQLTCIDLLCDHGVESKGKEGNYFRTIFFSVFHCIASFLTLTGFQKISCIHSALDIRLKSVVSSHYGVSLPLTAPMGAYLNRSGCRGKNTFDNV